MTAAARRIGLALLLLGFHGLRPVPAPAAQLVAPTVELFGTTPVSAVRERRIVPDPGVVHPLPLLDSGSFEFRAAKVVSADGENVEAGTDGNLRAVFRFRVEAAASEAWRLRFQARIRGAATVLDEGPGTARLSIFNRQNQSYFTCKPAAQLICTPVPNLESFVLPGDLAPDADRNLPYSVERMALIDGEGPEDVVLTVRVGVKANAGSDDASFRLGTEGTVPGIASDAYPGPDDRIEGEDGFFYTFELLPAEPIAQVVQLEFLDVASAMYRRTRDAPPVPVLAPGVYGDPDDHDEILGLVQAVYQDFDVDVVLDPPATGSYSRVWVGSMTPHPDAPLPPPVKGTADKIDFGNADPSDTAVVLTNRISATADATRNEAIAQATAHEIGHLLGLAHVIDGDQLMYPEADPGRLALGPAANLAGKRYELSTQDLYRVLPLRMDACACLAEYLGPPDPTKAAAQRTCFPGRSRLRAYLSLLGQVLSTDITGSDARLGVWSALDVAPRELDLGTLSGPLRRAIELEPGELGAVYLTASSTPGGPIDLFSAAAPPDGRGYDELSLEERSIAVPDLGDEPFRDVEVPIYHQASDGSTSEVGRVVLVPEPVGGLALAAGGALLAALGRARGRSRR